MTIRKYGIDILLGLGILIALFYRLGYMPLSADEPIRALIAGDMALNGHFIAPEMSGDVYLNKPPLYNWILLGFFTLFGSNAEWIVRLPSILSLIIFGLVIARIVKTQLHDLRLGILVAFAFITSGNLWIYSSYLGHIDVTYSLVTFLQLYALYVFAQKKQWFWAFGVSYSLAAVGFMMKGLPSIVFQGISVLTILIAQKEIKKFFHWKHIISGFFFLIPVGLYFLAFSWKYDVTLLFERLFTESSSRTVASKSFLESIGHLFAFPFLYLVDILPWGLALLIFVKRDARKLVWENTFLRTSTLLFITNILIYWLSPDYRARYVFMLTPFILIPSIYACHKLIRDSVKRMITIVFALISAAVLIYMHGFAQNEGFETSLPLTVGLGLLVIIGLFYFWKRPATYYSLLVLSLVVLRICYSQHMVPFRVETGPYLDEKEQAHEIADITDGADLGMYHSNVSLTMSWYLTIARNEVLETKTKDFDFSSFYLVPTEVIKDSSNVDTYFTFVRRYKQKPFSLVKFKYRFPKMPKKKD